MATQHDSPVIQREEDAKECVYKTFGPLRKTDRRHYLYCNNNDHDSFMEASDHATAAQEAYKKERLIRQLYESPYFAHLELQQEGISHESHYFLSDNESLETAMRIEGHGWLLPFKQDPQRPIFSKIRQFYMSPSGKPIVDTGRNGKQYVLHPKLVCDDTVKSRELLSITEKFPEYHQFSLTSQAVDTGRKIDADEFLEQKLQENRNDPTLRNIISTLQREQFDIISADLKTSFIVQGCAGSGKSQCLLHRLFFMRGEFSQSGWQNVLLLTPTHLFRNYSADLIRRYQLSGIHDCPIAELYQEILSVYDNRFKNRQYMFELSEEYLPDGYLQEVYSPESITHIEQEIAKSISGYVQEGCTILDSPMPETITSIYIARMLDELNHEIESFDTREEVLQQDPDYIAKRMAYEKAQKNSVLLQKRIERTEADIAVLKKEQENLQQRAEAVREADSERALWSQQRGQRISDARRNLAQCEIDLQAGFQLDMPAKYAQCLHAYTDLTRGQSYRDDEDYLAFLNDYCCQANKELSELTQGAPLEKAESKLSKKEETLCARMKEQRTQWQVAMEAERQLEEWLVQKAGEFEGQQSRKIIRRKELEHARYFLSRIESSVFEREVWQALAPIKEKYAIKTIHTEELDDGHHRETKILYKSDLLFYIKIYHTLHPNMKLPNYQMICIDEGQDLHQADYDMLHTLFPNASYNIFGDTEQVLHEACGIHNWTAETGIQKVYALQRNYRNTAAITDFCNRQFGAQMQYVGKVRKEQLPIVLDDAEYVSKALEQKGMVIIVKDKAALEDFCRKAYQRVSRFEYLDTHAEKPVESDKIPCYTIFAAKGLEFSSALVFAKDMTKNQKVVACTRAMERLYYYE